MRRFLSHVTAPVILFIRRSRTGDAVTPVVTASHVERLLTVVRLGDADRLGWWRSHSVDETAEYVLAHAFPNTWLATGVELAMESARIRHDMALGRATAVHLFSDYLPFHPVLRAWLIERKLEKDFEPLVWLPEASVDELKAKLGTAVTGERRGNGLYLGDVYLDALDDERTLQEILEQLSSAYAALDNEFLAPYLDLA